MKKTIACLPIFLIALISVQPPSIVQAQESNPCKPDPGKVTYFDEDQMGFEVTLADKTSPPFPIVFGQDLEDKEGVTIGVEVASRPGTISYESFDGYTEECVGQTVWEDGPKGCPPYYAGGKYYYKKSVPICTPHKDEQVYRSIVGLSLKVWLVPTDETLKWLGWNTDSTKDKYPLRYVFPEKWSLGTWTPGGFTTIGSDLMYTEEQIDQFIAENPGFEFLKSDPRESELPTYSLTRVQDPTTGNAPMRALGLFGEFYSWYRYGQISHKGECLVNRTGTNGSCATETNLSRSGGKSKFFNADLGAEGITYLRLDLNNVPVDLPGEWYVGVSVTVNSATYDNGRRTEVVPDSSKKTRSPGNGFNPKEHSFLVFILIASPCLANEVNGCGE
jgi:hypothetical protein